VIAGATLGATEPAGDAIHQRVVVDLQFNHRIQLQALARKHLVQCDGLRDGAGKAIQNETGGGVRLIESGAQHAHQDVVGYQPARLHHRLGLAAYRGAGGNLSPQHVTRRDLRDTVLVLQALGLRALARAGRPQKNEFHRRPFTLVLRISPSYWWASRCDCICVTVSMVTETTIRIEVPPK